MTSVFVNRPRVLVVEFEKAIRDIVVYWVFSEGFDWREAENGQAAIDLLASGTRIDLVVSNFMFPEVDGLTLLSRVKKCYPHIPFAFLSSIADAELALHAARSGADAYLELPCTGDDFRRMIRELV